MVLLGCWPLLAEKERRRLEIGPLARSHTGQSGKEGVIRRGGYLLRCNSVKQSQSYARIRTPGSKKRAVVASNQNALLKRALETRRSCRNRM